MLHLHIVVPIVASIIFSTVTVARATTYYVRASGDDTHDGLSPATAFASVRPAARLLQNPGDRLIVGPGTYNEGNIKPRGSGTAEAPIVLHGDTTGELTGDPAGPVVIVPPNTPDATTGIIVYGRSHVIIEGFDVDGADDAGIQVRPHSRTGADSSSITVRNNTVRNGAHKGIQVIGTGEVTVMGNTLVRNGGVGLALMGGESGALRPTVSDNNIDENRFALVMTGSTGGMISNNRLRSNDKGLTLRESDGLTLASNQVVALSSGALNGLVSNITIDDNEFETGGQIEVLGTSRITNNRFTSLRKFLQIHAVGTSLELRGNHLPITFISGLNDVTATNNTGHRLELYGQSAVIKDNVFAQGLTAWFVTSVEYTGNKANEIEIRAPVATVQTNEAAAWMNVLTAGGTVVGNRAYRILVARFFDYGSYPGDPSAGPYRVEGNTSNTTIRLGDEAEPLAGALVQNNVATEILRAFTRGEAQLLDNDVHGIVSIASGPDSRVIIRGNKSPQSWNAGIIALGATTAIIEGNTIADSVDVGLATRGVRNLTITNNSFRNNANGGISVLVPLPADCNNDLDSTVDELVLAVMIALDKKSVSACRAADFSGDSIVTIDELVLAAGNALGRPTVAGGTVEMRDNTVADNGRFGIDVATDGVLFASNNQVLRNGGIALALRGRSNEGSSIVGNTLGSGQAEGMFVRNTAAPSVRNNIVFSNREAGILLRDTPRASVINNLVYANGDDGISVGVGTAAATSDAVVASNTIYANAGWGLTIGTKGAESTGTTVLNNIIDGNLRGGVAAVADSVEGLALDYNLRNDANYESLPVAASDFEGDPLFVSAAGADGVLGGHSFADDDLHLQPNTPAKDAGSAPAAELGITGSAIAGLTVDSGVVDVGFHYGASDVAADGPTTVTRRMGNTHRTGLGSR